MLLNLVLSFGTFMGTMAFQWTSSATFPNGTRVNVCLGDSVTLPWSYEVFSSEQVIDIEWYHLFQNRETVLAAYINSQFLTYGDLDRQLEFVPNAGLRLHGVTSSDMGQYSVRVNLNGDQKSSQTALLHEPEAPVAPPGVKQAFISPTTGFPVINGESHLQLLCGIFMSLGEPPVSVTWRTPSGQFLNPVYDAGIFSLILSNPLEGGNYTCQLSEVPTALHCLQNNPIFRTTATVYVDDVTWSLLLLRNDMKLLREENARLTEEDARLRKENALLQAYNNQFELLDASVKPHSCLRIQDYDGVNRIHTIYPNGHDPVKVYCDQSTDNGGWTVIQRRQDGSVDFYRNRAEYENGFGNPASEYWIGLANLHQMTSYRTAVLRIDLMDFRGNTAYAMYNMFNVSGGSNGYYILHIFGYNGTAGDALYTDNNMVFSTYDFEYDAVGFDYNCAEQYHGAWWYSSCYQSNLNGRYYQFETTNKSNIFWLPFRSNYSLKRVEMKIRV